MTKPPRFASREDYEAWKRQRLGGDGAAASGSASMEPPPRAPEARPKAHAAIGSTWKCPTCSEPLTAPDAPCPECAPADRFESSGLELAERPVRPAPPAVQEELPPLGPAFPASIDHDAPEPTSGELNAIRGAVACGAFSGLVTGAVAAYASASGSEPFGLSGWSLLDAAVLLGLTYGTHRRSRAAAAGLFGFFLLGKIAMFVETGRIPGIITSFVLAAGMLRGATATFSFRARVREWKQEQRKIAAPSA